MSLTLLKQMYDESLKLYSKSESDFDRVMVERLKRVIDIMTKGEI